MEDRKDNDRSTVRQMKGKFWALLSRSYLSLSFSSSSRARQVREGREGEGKNRPRKFPRWCHPQAPVKKKETMWGLCDTYLGTFIGRLITPLLDSPLDITLKRKRTSGESKGVIGYIRNAIWAEKKRKISAQSIPDCNLMSIDLWAPHSNKDSVGAQGQDGHKKPQQPLGPTVN